MTVIMLCYFLIPLLQISRNKLSGHHRISLLLLILLWCTCFFLRYKFDVCFIYFAIFITGYWLSDVYEKRDHSFLAYGIFSTIMIIMQPLRLILRAKMDGMPLYFAFSDVSQALLGIWIFATFILLNKRYSNLFDWVPKSRLIPFLNKYSMYIYLTQGLFFMSPWNVYECLPLGIATVVFFLFVIVASIVMKYLSDFVVAMLDKCTKLFCKPL